MSLTGQWVERKITRSVTAPLNRVVINVDHTAVNILGQLQNLIAAWQNEVNGQFFV